MIVHSWHKIGTALLLLAPLVVVHSFLVPQHAVVGWLGGSSSAPRVNVGMLLPATFHYHQRHHQWRTFVTSSSASSSSNTETEVASAGPSNNNNNKNGNNNNSNNRDGARQSSYTDRRNSNYNNNNNNNRQPQQQRYYTSGGGGNSNYARTSGGGGGGSVFKLQNPMKLQRIVEEVTASSTSPSSSSSSSERSERRTSQQYSGGSRYASSGTTSTAPRSGGGGGAAAAASYKPRRSPLASVGDGVKTQAGVGDRPRKPAFGGGDADASSSLAATDLRRKRPPGPNNNNNNNAKKDRKSGDSSEDGRNARKASLRLGTGKKGRAAEVNQRRGSLKRRNRAMEKEQKAERALERRTVALPDGPISVSQLADLLDEKPVAIIKFLMTDFGVMASMTQSLDPSTCVAVVQGLGKIVAGSDEDDQDDELMDDDDEESALELGYVADEDDPDDLILRPPVVTIMGHVDHGKTSLLDAIRNTRVTAGEAGGITQHIAAYQVDHNGNTITFIDTPGHAAFTDMRARGANITDIVILVVAADDGVKQQTADSILCARQAGVPLVVAINKCDLDTADPVKVMTDLTAYDVLTEDFGGEVLCSQISAKQGKNLGDLLDKVMMQAELQDLKANPDRNAEGIVIEAYVEKGLGTVATTLIKKGTLRVGDIFVAGETYGRVRTLLSTSDGKTRMDEAGPSVPVRVVGFEGIPNAGDAMVVIDDEQTARELAENRQRIAREKQSSSYQAGLMSSVSLAFGSRKDRREMCVVVKADVQGSAEALTRALRELKLENEEAVVTVKVLVSEAGEVSKSDIAIASVTPGTIVLAFNVAASYAAQEDARMAGIPIEYYNIVYDAIESIESRMQEVLSPTPDGEYTGAATVQEVFNIGGLGNIAGSRCTDGYVRKGGNVRVMRGDKILTETKIKTLRNYKAEADQIDAGNDCGIGLMNYEDFLPGDVIECYIETSKTGGKS